MTQIIGYQVFYVTGNIVGQTAENTTRDIEIRAMPQPGRNEHNAYDRILEWAEQTYGLSNARWVTGPRLVDSSD